MKKGISFIFATTLFFTQGCLGTKGAPSYNNRGEWANCTKQSAGVSISPYTYCTIGNQYVDCSSQGAEKHQGSCYVCPTSNDNCDSDYSYSIYDSNDNVIDPGGCTDQTQTCPSIPNQNRKKRK